MVRPPENAKNLHSPTVVLAVAVVGLPVPKHSGPQITSGPSTALLLPRNPGCRGGSWLSRSCANSFDIA